MVKLDLSVRSVCSESPQIVNIMLYCHPVEGFWFYPCTFISWIFYNMNQFYVKKIQEHNLIHVIMHIDKSIFYMWYEYIKLYEPEHYNLMITN